MAYNPLQQKMADQGQVPAAVGVNVRQAAGSIAALLDDDAHDPGHTEVDNEDEHQRGADDQVHDDQLNNQADDQDLDDPNADAGDTDDEEGDEGDNENAADTGDDDQAGADDADSDAITTLAELAEASDIPIEEFLTALSHTVKAAGEDHTVTLADLVAGYQLKADYDRDKTAMAESRRSFEAEQQTRLAGYTQNANVLANQFNLVEQVLISQLNDPRLVSMRETDQAEYLLRVREIEQQVNGLRSARQQNAQQYEQTMQAARQEFMQAEGTKLREEVEGWDDEKLRASVDTIKTLGYSDDEVVGVVDSRLIKGALELASLRTEVATLRARIAKGEKAAGAVKRTVPKGIKPGKQVGKRTRGPDRNTVSKLKRRLSQTHDVKDAANVIESMMGN